MTQLDVERIFLLKAIWRNHEGLLTIVDVRCYYYISCTMVQRSSGKVYWQYTTVIIMRDQNNTWQRLMIHDKCPLSQVFFFYWFGSISIFFPRYICRHFWVHLIYRLHAGRGCCYESLYHRPPFCCGQSSIFLLQRSDVSELRSRNIVFARDLNLIPGDSEDPFTSILETSSEGQFSLPASQRDILLGGQGASQTSRSDSPASTQTAYRTRPGSQGYLLG